MLRKIDNRLIFVYVLAAISFVLFCFNYQICDLVYPDFENNKSQWWSLKQNIYNIIIMLSFFSAFISVYVGIGIVSFPLLFMSFIGLYNVIDRAVYNAKKFELIDVFLILLSILLSLLIKRKCVYARGLKKSS